MNRRKGEIAKTILGLVVATGIVVTVLALPGIGPVLSLFSKSDKKRRDKVYQALDKLKKQKLVRIYEKNGEEIIEITEKGRKRILKYRFEDIKINTRKKKWDGKFRMILFDIPQYKRRERRAITAKLRDMGCYHYQKSVFLAPHDCKDELDFVGNMLGIREWIRVATVYHIDQEERVKDFFHLT